MSDDEDIDDFDLDSETLNNIAATEAHFIASQNTVNTNIKSYNNSNNVNTVNNLNNKVVNEKFQPPRKLIRRTGPTLKPDSSSSNNSEYNKLPSLSENNTYYDKRSPNLTSGNAIKQSTSHIQTDSRDAILATELTRLRKQINDVRSHIEKDYIKLISGICRKTKRD